MNVSIYLYQSNYQSNYLSNYLSNFLSNYQSIRPDFHIYLSTENVEVFVDTLKLLCKLSIGQVKSTALQTLVNFTYFCTQARGVVFSHDLFEFLEQCGLSNVEGIYISNYLYMYLYI
jgi:hypothetical protein